MFSFGIRFQRERRSLTNDQIIWISQILESGLRSGVGLKEILNWISTEDLEFSIWAREICLRLKKESWFEIFDQMEGATDRSELKLFYSLLKELPQWTMHAAQNLRRFSHLLRGIRDLERETRSLVLVPQLQAIGAGILSLVYVFVLPAFMPNYFPSFLSQGRYFEFFAGILFFLTGLMTTWVLSKFPLRKQKALLRSNLFLHLIAYHLESGKDFARSWEQARSVSAVDQGNGLKFGFDSDSKQSVDEFLNGLCERKLIPWSEILMQIRWSMKSGVSLASVIKELAEDELKKMSHRWSQEAKAMSLILILPLSFICFPATIFLVVGPQLGSW